MGAETRGQRRLFDAENRRVAIVRHEPSHSPPCTARGLPADARRAAAVGLRTERGRGISLINVGRWALIAGFPIFVLVATANGAGYRYGTSDQAFYIPSVVRALDPAAFPRDAALIDS